MLDATLRRIERGEIDGIEGIDDLLAEQLSLRENRRVKAARRETEPGSHFESGPRDSSVAHGR